MQLECSVLSPPLHQ